MTFFAAWVFIACGTANLFAATDSLVWHGKEGRVDANIESWQLSRLLENIATATGWQVYVQPDAAHDVSAKFNGLSTGDALHSLLGNLNYAVVPQPNGPSRLYVFRTSQSAATRLVRAVAKRAKPIPNELVVTLKPGSKTKIEDLAKSLGAKIVGRMDDKNAYRLQFADEAAANAARDELANNPDVQSVDSNFNVARPPDVNFSSAPSADLQLKPKPNDGNCQLIIGLIDTPVQSLGKNLDSFLLPGIHVAGQSSANPATVTHGTAMADTMLGVLQKSTGGSTSVKILPVDVYGMGESTTTFDVANGVVKAVNGGADLINLSLGSSGDSPFLHNILTEVSKQGIPIFAAAGNEPVTTPTYPAAYPEVVAVTASDSSGNIASYANRGSFIDMIAPGDSYFNYNNQSYFAQGTSSATAFATSLAAGLADKAGSCADQAVPLLKNSLKASPSASTAAQR
jgi:hypothetical protein